MKKKIVVRGVEVVIFSKKDEDYISLTDIARYKENSPDDIIKNWLRNRSTIDFLGVWESIHNPDFNPVEFDGFRQRSGLNSFVLTAKRWIKNTSAIGLISRPGRYGGTYAHKDIAFEFASWLSVEFKLYLIKEFQRLKEEESAKKSLDWNLKRNLARINYKIHVDAIKNNLVPPKLSFEDAKLVYASEADILNKALFGMTAQDWSKKNKETGSLRDNASSYQLVILSNLENLNAEFIKEGMSRSNRLLRLNNVAISQMKLLVNLSENKLIK